MLDKLGSGSPSYPPQWQGLQGHDQPDERSLGPRDAGEDPSQGPAPEPARNGQGLDVGEAGDRGCGALGAGGARSFAVMQAELKCRLHQELERR